MNNSLLLDVIKVGRIHGEIPLTLSKFHFVAFHGIG